MAREWSAPESASSETSSRSPIRAVVAGADNRVDIESFGNAKIEWFETFHELPQRNTLA